MHALLSRLPAAIYTSPPIVPVVRLAGTIGALGPLRHGLTLAGVAEPLERAFRVPRARAVALVVNSPGGSPVQSALIAGRIRDLAAEHELPVYAFCEDVAASGGYWLACAADRIYAAETSIVGSIGVVSASFGFHDLLQRYGVERRLYTAGEKKVLLDPFSETDPEEVERLKRLQREMHESFQRLVRERRRDRLKAGDDVLFSGEFWTGRRAVELGLIDGLGEVRRTLRERFGERVKLKRIEAHRPWLRRRLPFGGLEEAGAAVGGRDWAGELLAAVEERALWSRYGL